MDQISYASTIPIHADADVIVVGGGPAGFAAALAARRSGCSVIILERSAQIGGAGTLYGVSIWMPIGVITGIYQEVVELLGRPDCRGRDFAATGKYAPQFDPAVVRHVLADLLVSSGVEVLHHCAIVDAQVTDGRVSSVVCHTPEGLRAFTGRCFIDCSGDARLARSAGVRTTCGRDSDGRTQPMTLMFQMVDTGRPQRLALPASVPRYERVEDLPQGRLLHWLDPQTGTLLVNMTRVAGNAALLHDRSRAEREGLRQALGVADYLQRTTHPTFALSSVAAEIGVRETHQIDAIYNLTEQDVLEGRSHADVACQADYGIDIHNPQGGPGTVQPKRAAPVLYDIPLRSLLPAAGPSNLCVAGRCLGASHVAMSAARVQPTCMGMGQAVGTASAMAIQAGIPIREVPIAGFHDRLHQQGVRFAARPRTAS
jgi:hypothetical protein